MDREWGMNPTWRQHFIHHFTKLLSVNCPQTSLMMFQLKHGHQKAQCEGLKTTTRMVTHRLKTPSWPRAGASGDLRNFLKRTIMPTLRSSWPGVMKSTFEFLSITLFKYFRHFLFTTECNHASWMASRGENMHHYPHLCISSHPDYKDMQKTSWREVKGTAGRDAARKWQQAFSATAQSSLFRAHEPFRMGTQRGCINWEFAMINVLSPALVLGEVWLN